MNEVCAKLRHMEGLQGLGQKREEDGSDVHDFDEVWKEWGFALGSA